MLDQLRDKVADVGTMRALGFCVSVDHARYMAERFVAAGIPARAVVGLDDSAERRAALAALRNGEINVLFTVDLFNEGVDIPLVDTVLFLRPTESATVFLQQLGRGLRLARARSVLTALDFVGHQRKEFRFDQRFRALTGLGRKQLESRSSKGFRSCHRAARSCLTRWRRSWCWRTCASRYRRRRRRWCRRFGRIRTIGWPHIWRSPGAASRTFCAPIDRGPRCAGTLGSWGSSLGCARRSWSSG